MRVFSVGRERGVGKVQRAMLFYSRLTELLLSQRYDACFAHMQPLFAVMASPLLQLRSIPITTWYTHRQMSRTIALAERVSYRIVSAVESSFPMQTAKLRALGHGIDTDFFTPNVSINKHHPPRIVQVARLTDIKHQHIVLEAAHDLDCEIVFVGDIPDGYDDTYKQRLIAQVHQMGIGDKVIFAGAQTPQQVRDWYRSATVALNLSPSGLFDKAALESMACAIPTIVSNDAFQPLTREFADKLHIPQPDDVMTLRNQLETLFALSDGERQQIGQILRQRVVEEHSLNSLIPKLICVMHNGEIAS
ncbi:MAG: glycosyltransferase family 4 protein [Anaerolineae bacterium]|nr:glycosyltransferase family 4 protein [Anaerolineae bacterium]